MNLDRLCFIINQFLKFLFINTLNTLICETGLVKAAITSNDSLLQIVFFFSFQTNNKKK